MATRKCKGADVAHILDLGEAPGWTLQGSANFPVKGQTINISGTVGPAPLGQRSRKVALDLPSNNELGCVAINSDLAPSL